MAGVHVGAFDEVFYESESTGAGMGLYEEFGDDAVRKQGRGAEEDGEEDDEEAGEEEDCEDVGCAQLELRQLQQGGGLNFFVISQQEYEHEGSFT